MIGSVKMEIFGLNHPIKVACDNAFHMENCSMQQIIQPKKGPSATIKFTNKLYSRYHLPPSITEIHNNYLPKYVQYRTPILYLILTLVPHILHTLHTLTSLLARAHRSPTPRREATSYSGTQNNATIPTALT